MRDIKIERCDGVPCLKGKNLTAAAENSLDLQEYNEELLAVPCIEIK